MKKSNIPSLKMKAVTFALFVVVLVALAQAAPVENLDSKWEDFKKTHKKVYATVEEETRRKEIFTKNLEGIEAHNKKFAAGEVTFQQGVNAFTDETTEEFASKRFGLIPETVDASKRTLVGL